MFFLPRLRSSSDELLNLDLLRFVASVGIVAHHSIEFFLPAEYREVLPEHTMGLALFVDLFFVVSGFVIAYVYHDRVGTIRNYCTFMQRRIGRLVPLHLLTLLVAIFIWGGVIMLGKAANHIPSFQPRCIAQTALFLHAIVECDNGLTFNSVSWSIGAEMIMYLLFPALAWAGFYSRTGLAMGAGALLVGAVIFDSFVETTASRSWVELWPAFRALPSFAIGSSMFYWRDALRKIPRAASCLGASLLLLVAAMTTGVSHVLVLALVYVVAGSAVAADMQGSVRPIVRKIGPLGQLTYSMYMWHSILILLFMNAIGDKILHAKTGLMLVIGMACYASILGLAYISFLFIETPARRWIDGLRLFSASPQPVTAKSLG
ncbi:acyltransferase [Bradyrhizobium sp. WYCCWR 12699]|uniref:acyltransferase family protein n=1 Tax=Bradyrhizobium sp. WYCCWR 12699 TaxID=3064203 RepID=UPI0028A33CEA|nr:acyltransferase [Bradyrhizobium sp. WYCCWR 12699]MDT4743664.1 acyltransferase [Bradyrhizobium sp. WYCCWR 12699]